jgi:hypothetical protein
MSDKKVKLTPAQVEVLRELVKPGAYAFLDG